MAATYCVVAIFWETRGEEEEEEEEEEKDEGKEVEEEEEARRRSLVSVFAYHEGGRAFFFGAPSLAGSCFMAIVCARQMAQKRDRMLPLGEPSGLKYDRGGG